MRATAQAHPNIALVKYWGKRDVARNLPAVSSLSVTLDSLFTRTTVEFLDAAADDRLVVNGEDTPALLPRVSDCLDRVAGADRAPAAVTSEGNFPIAAGLASSASAFAALVVAANAALGNRAGTLELARAAGNASGSAARSLYGGIVELTAKPVGSGEAMLRSAATSPFYTSWVERQEADLAVARRAVAERDFRSLATVAEHNCLKMHSVMWTSRPPVVYWNSATLSCLQAVRQLQDAGHAVFFTMDAGPQLKAICLPEDVAAVRDALADCSGVRRTLVSGLGSGATLVEPR